MTSTELRGFGTTQRAIQSLMVREVFLEEVVSELRNKQGDIQSVSEGNGAQRRLSDVSSFSSFILCPGPTCDTRKRMQQVDQIRTQTITKHSLL